MFCRRCGAQVVDGAEFCPECGERLQAPRRAKAEPRPGRACEVLGLLALCASLLLQLAIVFSDAGEVVEAFAHYEAPLAAVAACVFAGFCFLLSCLSVLGASALARDLIGGGPRSRGPLVRGAVAAGFIVVCCLSLLVGASLLGGAADSEGARALCEALDACWNGALYGVAPAAAALIALCLGCGQLKNAR